MIRETDERGERPYDHAVVADFVEIGDELPLEEFLSDLRAWLDDRRGAAPFEVEIRRSYLSAGAEGIGALLLITFLGTTGGTVAGLAIYDALLAFVKERLVRDEPARRASKLESLWNEDPDHAATHLAGSIARALDCRRADVRLVEFNRGAEEIRAEYDVGADRYEICVDENGYRITRTENARDMGR